MTWYEMHRCVHDSIRFQEQGRAAFDATSYDLSEAERTAIDSGDIGALYRLGLHGVLLNRYCRQLGISLDDYRRLLQPYAVEQERRGRWQRSS